MAVTSSGHKVNFPKPRSFATKLKSDCKETLFPDDPFKQFRDEEKPGWRIVKAVKYYVPIFYWLPKYNIKLFGYDLLAGITVTSLAIPQGISYAKLANIPPVIGLYSSFIPPFVYAVFGSSNYIAVGTVASGSLILAEKIGEKLSADDSPQLYLHLVITATFFIGILQTALGFLRLGILVDFLSQSTIIGFMGGTAVIICLQQLKGVLGMTHFTHKTDVVSVMHGVFKYRNEWRWESAVMGLCFLIFLLSTRYLKKKKPNLFWVSAMAPMVTVVTGCLFAYFAHAEEHGIALVGPLKKGLNPPSVQNLNFDSQYLSTTMEAAFVAGVVALAEGIAIGRSFAIMKNEQIDGNKEMIAFGFMNIVGSLTSCYLTTGPFSKTAVNFNAGCKTAMSNIIMGLCMMLVLLFLAPLFSYTPLVALSAIIMAAMLGLIKYEEAYRIFKIDKVDFLVCISAFFGVVFISMDIGLMMSVGISLVRALIYVARPATCKLGRLPDSALYRDIEQYPLAKGDPGILALQLGSPIYFANCNYIRERILRWIRDSEVISNSKSDTIEHILLDFSGVTSIDMTGIATLKEIHRIMEAKSIKMFIINPRIEVMDKMILSKSVDTIGHESFFLSIEDAMEAIRYSLQTTKQVHDHSGVPHI